MEHMSKQLNNEKILIFSESEIPEVVDYLYNYLNDCKILAFSGPLGAGKTTLIRELLHKCGVKEPIRSPTFIYVNRYKNDQGQVFYHFDLYRIEELTDFLEAGFDEYLEDPNGWCLIEWPEVIEPILKGRACFVFIDYYNDKRKLHIKM